jgi:agmatine/peptidylarginine deiminase
MVTDRLTDTVYFSGWALKDFPGSINNVCKLLDKYGIKYGFLRHTKDYWCRDYMPIQVNETKFVQYAYAPDYLQNEKDRRYITNPTAVLHDLNIPTVKTNLIIDGGNIIKCSDRVIMTEKVFSENKNIPRNKVIAMLEQLFECSIVFLPWDKSEIYGHADGIVRWVNGNTVLLTAYEMSRYFANKFLKELERNFDIIVMKYSTRPRNREHSWAYINFLQTKNVIIVPVFNIKEDEQALQQIKVAFPEYQDCIEPVDISNIINHGGGLNCISWNIKQSSEIHRTDI